MKKNIKYLIPLISVCALAGCGTIGERGSSNVNKAVLDKNSYSYRTKSGTNYKEYATSNATTYIDDSLFYNGFIYEETNIAKKLVSTVKAQVVVETSNLTDNIEYVLRTFEGRSYLEVVVTNSSSNFVSAYLIDRLGNVIIQWNNESDFGCGYDVFSSFNYYIDQNDDFLSFINVRYQKEGKLVDQWVKYVDGAPQVMDKAPEKIVGTPMKHYGYEGYSYQFTDGGVIVFKNNTIHKEINTHFRDPFSLHCSPTLIGKYMYYQLFVTVDIESEDYDYYDPVNDTRNKLYTYRIDLIGGREEEVETNLVINYTYPYFDKDGNYKLCEVYAQEIKEDGVLDKNSCGYILNEHLEGDKFIRDFYPGCQYKIGDNYVDIYTGIIVDSNLDVIAKLPCITGIGENIYGRYAVVPDENYNLAIYDCNGKMVSDYIWDEVDSYLSNDAVIYLGKNGEYYAFNTANQTFTLTEYTNYGDCGFNTKTNTSNHLEVYSFNDRVAEFGENDSVNKFIELSKFIETTYIDQAYSVAEVVDSVNGTYRFISLESNYKTQM